MEANTTIYEFIWLCKLIVGLTSEMLKLIMVYCDNHSCIRLFENLP
jgi:hypothetical protein